MTKNELIRRFPAASHSFLKANSAGDPLPDPQLKPALFDVSLAAASGKGKNTGRFHVCFTSYRRKLISDRTNLEAGIKYFEDCLVYSGLVPGDSESEITRTVRQVKVATKAEERTEISIL